VPELGRANGYAFFLKDNIGLGHTALLGARNQLLGAAAQNKLLLNVRPNGMEDTPQLRVDVDIQKAAALGLSMADINATLATAWGGSYIDDYLDRGRVKRVYLQSDAPFRMTPEDFDRWSVRNNKGEMTPVSSIATSRWSYGSPRLERYNGVSAMEINGEAKPGVSTGEAMAEVERLVGQLPPGIGIEWTGVSYQERAAGAQAPLLYALSLLVVFLCLAALYESWSIPTAVLMVAPLGVLGAVLATWLRGMERDVYFQVAMLTTVGLTSKNAILIIEFAKANLESGLDLITSIMNAVRDRMRPIVMTSLAFGLGVLPLAIAVGAGSGTQRAIGTGVLGGMAVGTLLGMFFTPLFFLVIQRLFGGRKKPDQTAVAGSSELAAAGVQAHG
jgi:multidrug efflux pump